MKFEIKDFLKETEQKHSDMLDAYAYMIASHYAKLADDYILLHVKNCPKWFPKKLYKLFLSKILVLNRFK